MRARLVGIVLLIAVIAGAGMAPLPLHAQGGGDADDVCPVFVADALALVAESCADLGVDEACYGHADVAATFWETDAVAFEAPSDRAPLLDVQTITTAPLDLDAETWGVALLSLRADLEAVLPGQAVTFMLMGDSALEAVEAGSMQAVYFTAGLGATACQEAPNALVVQNPSGQEVALNINGFALEIGSTMVFTSVALPDDPDTRLLVGVLIEGEVTLSYGEMRITLDEPGAAFAATVNADGIAGDDTEFVDLGDYPDAADAVAALVEYGCLNAAALGLPPAGLDPDACAVTPTYTMPPPPESTGADLPDVGPTDPCTLAALSAVNLREGPGTNYNWVGQLAAGERATPDGIVTGADGYTWYRLEGGAWVRGDLVNAAGACAALEAAITPVPPTPPPPSGADIPGFQYYEVGGIGSRCAAMAEIVAGQELAFQVGTGRWETVAEMEAFLAPHHAVITIDGVELPVYYEGPAWHTGGPDPDGWGNRARANWTATSGTHTVIGYWTHWPGQNVCTFTVP